MMLWGGCKNYLGHSKSCDHNVMIYPGFGRSSSTKPCQTDDNSVFANQCEPPSPHLAPCLCRRLVDGWFGLTYGAVKQVSP